jgi:hypothetical protein
VTFAEQLHLFCENPFSFIDNLNLRYKWVDLNIFKNYERLRKSILVLSLVCLCAWVIFGFDSNLNQFLNPLVELLPQLIDGKLTLSAFPSQFIARYNYYYGLEMHYSAFVFYGLLFVFLSKHYEKFGIVKSKNIAYATAITCLSIGLFELYWVYSFVFWQNQPWVASWTMPQLRIILQNLVAFPAVGVIGVLYMWADSYILEKKQIVGRRYRFRWDWIAVALIGLSIALAVLWWYYPWPTQQITVNIATPNGSWLWTSSVRYPQTLYTVDANLMDNVAAGIRVYVPNDAVHGLNTLVKLVWTVTVGYIALIRKPQCSRAEQSECSKYAEMTVDNSAKDCEQCKVA